LGHKKSTLVERQAPDAMATAVTATCVMADVTAPWSAEPEPAAAAIAFPEAKTEPREEETERPGATRQNMLRRRFRELAKRWSVWRSNGWVLWAERNMVGGWLLWLFGLAHRKGTIMKGKFFYFFFLRERERAGES